MIFIVFFPANTKIVAEIVTTQLYLCFVPYPTIQTNFAGIKKITQLSTKYTNAIYQCVDH